MRSLYYKFWIVPVSFLIFFNCGQSLTDSNDSQKSNIEIVKTINKNLENINNALMTCLSDSTLTAKEVENVLKTNGMNVLFSNDTESVIAEMYNDGPLVIIPLRSTIPSQIDSSMAAATAGLVKKLNAPEGATVHILAGLNGRGFENWTGDVETMFAKGKKGYNVKRAMATLDNFSLIKDASVLLIYSHGSGSGSVYIPTFIKDFRIPLYCLSSSDEPTDELTTKYLTDIQEKSIIFSWDHVAQLGALDRLVTGDTFEYKWHYAVDRKFVDKYWTFSKNSLIFLASCNSARNTDFHDAIYNKHGDLIVGFTGFTETATAQRCADFLFDRLLGANHYKPLNTAQRPFGIDEIFDVMDAKGISLQTGEYVSKCVILRNNNSKFKFLAPSIKMVTPDDKKQELTIEGSFGDSNTTSSVTVNETKKIIKSWTDSKIVCQLGLEDYGNVIVETQKHPSNPVPLTMWNGVLQFIEKMGTSVYNQANVNFVLRSDVHKYREKPDGEPKTRVCELRLSRAAFCDYKLATTLYTPQMTYDYTGGTLSSPYVQTTATQRFALWGSVDLANKTVLNLSAYCSVYLPNVNFTIIDAQFKVDPGITIPVAFDIKGTDLVNKSDESPDDAPDKFSTVPINAKFSFDNNFNIAGGSAGPFPIASDDGATAELQWTSISAKGAPSSNTPE